ncbi:aldehyde dehydrogenase family protein [Ensifer sp. SL37]|nr:aldehyde dehydrogenase family protein [Ensifer sp. SL37]MCY1745904.1 aldehyde dehydrogenase family protein [Ensifer sp. SL37]
MNVVLADAEGSARLVADPRMVKVSFTGSVGTGNRIADVVAPRMGRLTVEMGGKSAAIILADADLKQAMRTLERFTMPFSGQFCLAQTRIPVPRSRETEVVEAYASRLSTLKIGNPWEADTDVGSLLNTAQFEEAVAYISQGLKDGAEIVTGGIPDKMLSSGNYVEPTVFRNVPREMSIARKEIFGPVVTVQTFEGIDEAIAIANDTDFGLSGSIFGNPVTALEIARKNRTGQVHINGM